MSCCCDRPGSISLLQFLSFQKLQPGESNVKTSRPSHVPSADCAQGQVRSGDDPTTQPGVWRLALLPGRRSTGSAIGGGHHFAVNVHQGETPICILARATCDDGWIVDRASSNHEPEPDQHCLGYVPRQLMVKVQDGVEPEKPRAHLLKEHGEAVAAVEIGPFGLLHAHLTEPFLFRENLVKTRLEKDPRLMGMVEYIEHNPVASLVGTPMLITAGHYEGFGSE